MSETLRSNSLQPALQKAQAELARHLEEACEAQEGDISHGSVDELLDLEEELLAAARAADEAVRLRRRLEERGEEPGEVAGGVEGGASATAGARTPTPPPAEAGGRVREFRDRQGQAWRVWEVRPGLGRPLRELHRYLGDYVNGWLAFGCLDNDLRKRLPKFPPDWLEMSDREIEALMHRAVDVRKRVGGSG